MDQVQNWLINLWQMFDGSKLPSGVVIFISLLFAALLCCILLCLYLRAKVKNLSGTKRRALSSFCSEDSAAIIIRLEKIEKTINDLQSKLERYQQYCCEELKNIRLALSDPFDGEPISRSEGITCTSTKEIENDLAVSGELHDLSTVCLDVECHATKSTLDEGATTEVDTTDLDSISKGLKKTRESFFGKIKGLFAKKSKIDQEIFEDLEACLIGADLGVPLVTKLLDELKSDLKSGVTIGEKELIERLKIKITEIVSDGENEENTLEHPKEDALPYVVMIVGVNGTGKTTTAAKLAYRWKCQGKRVLLAAADTFRAAACDQLEKWGKKLDVPVVRGEEGAKPGTVAFDAMQRAQKEKYDVLVIDTAGRLQTQSNLMQELTGIKNIIKRLNDKAPHETILVLDGATGQNALSQARQFNEAVQLTGLVITKLDGTPKGGIVVAVKSELGIPIRYIGVGESKKDLKPFDSNVFVEALFKDV